MRKINADLAHGVRDHGQEDDAPVPRAAEGAAFQGAGHARNVPVEVDGLENNASGYRDLGNSKRGDPDQNNNGIPQREPVAANIVVPVRARTQRSAAGAMGNTASHNWDNNNNKPAFPGQNNIHRHTGRAAQQSLRRRASSRRPNRRCSPRG